MISQNESFVEQLYMISCTTNKGKAKVILKDGYEFVCTPDCLSEDEDGSNVILVWDENGYPTELSDDKIESIQEIE